MRPILRVASLGLFLAVAAASAGAQDFNRWNFNIGGGFGFPSGDASDFVNTGGNFSIGGGYNFNQYLGMNVEYLWHGLPIKEDVLIALDVPAGSARQHSLTFNGIVRAPLRSERFGLYGIGGVGWYHASGELTAPVLVPGTICDPYWIWWGVLCVDALIPVDAVLDSRSADAFGGNIGGGFTIRLGEGNTKFYTELRYHRASYDGGSIGLFPITFGLRW